jgi:hypothetical protein
LEYIIGIGRAFIRLVFTVTCAFILLEGSTTAFLYPFNISDCAIVNQSENHGNLKGQPTNGRLFSSLVLHSLTVMPHSSKSKAKKAKWTAAVPVLMATRSQFGCVIGRIGGGFWQGGG